MVKQPGHERQGMSEVCPPEAWNNAKFTAGKIRIAPSMFRFHEIVQNQNHDGFRGSSAQVRDATGGKEFLNARL